MRYLLFSIVLFSSISLSAQNSFDIGLNLFSYKTYNFHGFDYHQGRFISAPLNGMFFKIHNPKRTYRIGANYMKHDLADFFDLAFAGDSIQRVASARAFNVSGGLEEELFSKKFIKLFAAGDFGLQVTELEEERYWKEELIAKAESGSKGILFSVLLGVELKLHKNIILTYDGGIGFRTGIDRQNFHDLVLNSTTQESNLSLDLLFLPVNTLGIAIRM